MQRRHLLQAGTALASTTALAALGAESIRTDFERWAEVVRRTGFKADS